MMRKSSIGILSLLLAACASTPELPPAAGFSRVEFVNELATPEAQKLLFWSEGRLYYARKDGSVLVTDEEGHKTIVLQAKETRGEPVLKKPEAIAIGNNGIYIADSANNRIAMFSMEGKYLGSFGSKGSGRGELNTPRGIAFYDGVIYVSDGGNERIQLFGDNGVFLSALEIRDSEANRKAKEKKLPFDLKQPANIDLDANGRIYVLDDSDSMIKVYNQHGDYLSHIVINGKPSGFRVGSDGLYVTELASYTIQKFDLNGKLAFYFGSKGVARSQFKSISGLAFDGDRKIYIGDSLKGVTDIFQSDASPVAPSGIREVARTSVRFQQEMPFTGRQIAWDGNDTLYAISDGKNIINRIRHGKVESSITLKDIVPAAITTDKEGYLWLIDKKMMRIVRVDATGSVVASFGTAGSGAGQLDDPTDIAVSSSGIVFVADPGNGWVQAFSRDGLFLSVIRNNSKGKFENPIAIAIDPRDNLYVLDRGRGSISSFSAKGEPLGEFGNIKQQNGTLSSPMDLMATQDEVQVLEHDCIKVFTPQGSFLRSFGASGKGNGLFSVPTTITATGDTSFTVVDSGKLLTFATLYRPAAPSQVAAQGRAHGADIHWADAGLPYIKQYAIYRAASENGNLTRVGETTGNEFTDRDLPPGQHFYYRIAAENHYGLEGPMSSAVEATPEKYNPPVLESVDVEPHEWHLKLSWKPLETRYVRNYLIYQKHDGAFVKIGQTTVPEYTRDSLTPDTNYSFYISTLSVDGIESDKLMVNASTLTTNKAPLEIETVELNDIFSNTYKLYETKGMGRVRLINNTDAPMENIKVAFSIKNFMDYPSETKVAHLAPGESQEFPLKAVFNNNILTVTEDTPVQTELVATYFENGQQKSYTKNQAINVYETHRLIWSEHGRFAAFVTPKDPVVLDYARAIATQYPEVHEPLQWAAAIFDAMALTGLTYIPDPSNPYQITSGATDYVDYIQYPRETLERKSGDCDDLVALYSTALESMGITTRVIEVPGHMLMMLSTGISADSDNNTMDGMYVILDGVLWIPVETTLVGNTFTKAWESGSKTYYKWQGKGLTLLNVHEAWGTYKPASLPLSNFKPPVPSRKAIDGRFPDQQATLLRIVSRTRMRNYLQAIEQNPKDMNAHLQAGIISAKVGDNAEAMKYFTTVLMAEPGNATALNDRGNVLYMEEKYQEAVNDYETAAQNDPKDPLIWVNIAKSYQALKDNKKAKSAFQKAQEIDPAIKKRYRTMAIDLLGSR